MSIILPWEKCPCGSDKRFLNCCLSLGHSYQKLKTPAGSKLATQSKNIIIDETIYNDAIEHINGFIDYHISQPLETNLKDYGNLLYYIDQIMLMFYKYTDCHKSCSHCCYMVVSITQFEALYIKQYIKHNCSKTLINNFHSKIKQLKSEHPEIFDIDFMATENRTKIRTPCIFLENNCCSIYNARPAICRTYISLSPSEVCYDALFNPQSNQAPIEINMLDDFLGNLFDYHTQVSKITGICALPYWFQNM